MSKTKTSCLFFDKSPDPKEDGNPSGQGQQAMGLPDRKKLPDLAHRVKLDKMMKMMQDDGKEGVIVKKKLKPSYMVFVAGMVKNKTPQEAAIAAGYSPKPRPLATQINRMLTNVDIIEAIREGKKRITDKTELTEAYVINGLMEVADLCKASDKPGTATPAFGILAKHLGLLIDRSEITITGETLEFLRAVVGIVDQEIDDQEAKDRIASRIAELESTLK